MSIQKFIASKCATCGQIFTSRHGNQKYCSAGCRKTPKVYTTHNHTCRSCKKTFRSKYKTDQFCSRECGNTKTEIKCRCCGIDIEVTFRDIYRIKYCSKQCRKEAKRKQDRKAKKRWLAKQPLTRTNKKQNQKNLRVNWYDKKRSPNATGF